MVLKNLIGKGMQADVYEYEGRAVKLFHKSDVKSDVFCEAALISMIEKTGLPCAKLYDVVKINGQWAIIMDHHDPKNEYNNKTMRWNRMVARRNHAQADDFRK